MVVRALLRRRKTVSSRALPLRRHLEGAIQWILLACEHTTEGGISAGYDPLRRRWLPSYPETTGYTIPTLFVCARAMRSPLLRETAVVLADYLLRVRTADGGVAHWKQDGARRDPPVVFDTGQVIFGWLAAWRESGNATYLEAADAAGAWLLEVQDASGAWTRYQHQGTVKVIDTRVDWALLQLAEATGKEVYASGARRNLDWALRQQQPNGWFQHASFLPGEDPFTHTVAYTAEGLLESGLQMDEQRYIVAAEKVARVMLNRQRPDGALASAYDADWRPKARSTCLTGDCQMALLWLRLYGLSGTGAYLAAARRAIAFVASTQDLRTSNPNIRGAIAGSWPIYGRYARFRYPNWAAKFFIDALLAVEEADRRGQGAGETRGGGDGEKNGGRLC
jgi:hypothetical protein